MNIRKTNDGRLVLGDPNTTCASCGASAVVKHAANRKAELWHAPTDCCEWSRARERRFDHMRREEEHRARERQEALDRQGLEEVA